MLQDVIPIHGYMVVNFNDKKAFESYKKHENSKRRCISTDFIDRCIKAGRIEEPIFVNDAGQRVKVWLHPRLNEDAKNRVQIQLLVGSDIIFTLDDLLTTRNRIGAQHWFIRRNRQM